MDTHLPSFRTQIPSHCDPVRLQAFVALVREGGEVALEGFERRVRSATSLAFCDVGPKLAGVAGLKQPLQSYRDSVALRSGCQLPSNTFPLELGWVYVSPAFRGKGLARKLCELTVYASNGAGLFATSRTENEPMHRILSELGFRGIGEPYVGRDNVTLRVFVRDAA